MNLTELQTTPTGGQPAALELFCSYSHADEVMWQQLEKHLEVLRRTGVITIWSDRKLDAGNEWAGEIDSHLESSHIILFLISSDFLASSYCMDIEVKRAMERHNSGDACLVPIILRPVDWFGHPLSQFQALPVHAKPITQWADRDEGFLSVATGLRRIVETFQESKKRKVQLTAPTVASSSTTTKDVLPPFERQHQRRWIFAAIIAAMVIGAGAWFSHRSQKEVSTPTASALAVHVSSVDKAEYVHLPAGEFTRGCNQGQAACNADAQPQQRIQLSSPFWMAQTLVTNQNYQAYLKAIASIEKPGDYTAQTPYDPVINVSWQDAANFCQWAGGRLPFEAEWEYAAKAGGTGEEPVGWFLNDSGSGTHRVATVPPNRWSLYDTLGNVWEWCLDWYEPDYYTHAPTVCPLGPDSGMQRVVRGGSWRDDGGTIFTYTRSKLFPNSRADNVGFRCVVDNPAGTF